MSEVGGRLPVTGKSVDVVADRDTPAAGSSLATKTDTPLIATPRGVSVVKRRTLDELQAINVSTAHDHVPSFTPGVLARLPGRLLRPAARRAAHLRMEHAGACRRGARAVPARARGRSLWRWQPGRARQPGAQEAAAARRHELSLGAGELGFLRATADSSGPLGRSRGARYRLVAAAEGLANGYDNDESRVSVLPMLSFDLGSRTTLHLDGEYYDQRGRGYRHTVPATAVTQAGDFSAIPWELKMASPDDRWRGWNASGGLRLDAQLSERASLHVAARYTWTDGDLDIQALAALQPDGHALPVPREERVGRVTPASNERLSTGSRASAPLAVGAGRATLWCRPPSVSAERARHDRAQRLGNRRRGCRKNAPI